MMFPWFMNKLSQEHEVLRGKRTTLPIKEICPCLLLNQKSAATTTVADSKMILFKSVFLKKYSQFKVLKTSMQKYPSSVCCQYFVQAHGIRISASSDLSLCQDLLTSLDPVQGFPGQTICPDFLSVGSRETRHTTQYCVNMQPSS